MKDISSGTHIDLLIYEGFYPLDYPPVCHMQTEGEETTHTDGCFQTPVRSSLLPAVEQPNNQVFKWASSWNTALCPTNCR